MVDVLMEETLLEVEALRVKTGGREEMVDVLVEETLLEIEALGVKTGAFGFKPLE